MPKNSVPVAENKKINADTLRADTYAKVPRPVKKVIPAIIAASTHAVRQSNFPCVVTEGAPITLNQTLPTPDPDRNNPLKTNKENNLLKNKKSYP